MRLILASVVLATGIVAAPSPARPDYCETVGCWRQCERTPGGRSCHTVCRRRCWRTPPPFVPPPPVYVPPAPVYVAPYTPASADPTDIAVLLAILAILAGLVVLIAGIVAAARSGSADQAIADDTATTEEITRTLEDAARQADAHIAGFLEQERRRGGRRG